MSERFPVAETFLSINGEGLRAGQLAFFIRFSGCNLSCSYCDTRWACREPAAALLTAEELVSAVLDSGARNVTITGGEPLCQQALPSLLALLSAHPDLTTEIETNGSLPLSPVLLPSVRITMDYKLPGSGMEPRMCLENFSLLRGQDVVKFVCGSRADLERAAEIIETYDLETGTHVYLSPVFGQLDPAEMVAFMKERALTRTTLQLQLHKFIWPPDKRGV